MPLRAPNGPAAFVLNYREILGSCRLRQFPFGVDILEVQADVVRGGVEEFGHEPLRQPQSLGVNENTHMNFLVVAGVE